MTNLTGVSLPRAFIAGAAATSLLAAATVLPASAEFPFGGDGSDPGDYTRLHIDNGSCDGVAPGEKHPPDSDLPDSFECRGHWKLSDYRSLPGEPDYDPLVNENPQELMGVRGPGTNLAWEVTTGRPDTVIAVTDSGIRWDEPRADLMNKFYLNRGELPEPTGPDGTTTPGVYDVNADGVFNVADYADDPRVDGTLSGSPMLDPGDLIRAFGDQIDNDANGYPDDISGWDFFEGDNDPNDDTDYGHGTGESEDSGGEVDVSGVMPQCPNCMLMEMRVGDSFIADINHFAEAAVYAVDNGASVIQSALGTLNHTAFGQAAADYAWDNGVLFVASAADESSGHHNYPSALNHTMTMNSVTHQDDVPPGPATWLALNGCTNWGGYIWATVASTSCSSDAVGQSAGQAGLIYSAARNAVDRGVIDPHPAAAGRPISASEAKQIFRLGADDVDFSTPAAPFPPNNEALTLPGSKRFTTTQGWDQITGWGRTNSNAMVRMIETGAIPPEADLVEPRWWQPLGTTGTAAVRASAAAVRAGSFTWELQYAPGVQPPRWPLPDAWTTFADGASPTGDRVEIDAVLDLAAVRAALDAAPPVYTPADDPISPDLPEQDAVRIRLVVIDDRDDTGDAIEQRQVFVQGDPSLHRGFPLFLGADGAGSPAFADLDGDGDQELVISDGNGLVHAFEADGSELAGFPVHTSPLPLPVAGSNGFSSGDVESEIYAPVLLGTPTIADIDPGVAGLEISVADLEGFLHVWHDDGSVADGFPVQTNPDFWAEPSCAVAGGLCDDESADRDQRDSINWPDRGFSAPPAAADIDPSTDGLELIAGAHDGHVYAFHADGSAVDGWPVLLRDPAKVASIDPVTHKVTHTADSGVRYGTKVLAGVSVTDVDADGDLEIAANVNEEYQEEPNWSGFRDLSLNAVGFLVDPGNTRTYLLHHDGTAHPQPDGDSTPDHPHDQAYVPGWPVKVGMLTLELLPDVGAGSNGAPVFADVDGDGRPEIGTASIAGPPYLFNADGTGHLGTDPQGHDIPMSSFATETRSTATDYPSFASLGGGVFGRVGGTERPAFAMGATGLRRLLDVVLPHQQLLGEDHISVWDTTTGTYQQGFPAITNDLMFFNTPTIADVTGDGAAEVLQSSAFYDLRAYGAGGAAAASFPKFTGGWSVSTPGVGDFDGDGHLDVALATREGNLFVWSTHGDACQDLEWGQYQHDLANTGAHGTDATAPGPLVALAVSVVGLDVSITVGNATDDGSCGTASLIEILVGGEPVLTVPVSTSPSTKVMLAGATTGVVTIRSVDEAGNRGPLTTVRLTEASSRALLMAPSVNRLL